MNSTTDTVTQEWMEACKMIRHKLTPTKPKDYPKKIIDAEGNVYYSGDTIEFASNEHEYFTFGMRIKQIL